MTTALAATNLTLLDLMKRTRPDLTVETRIIELLTQRNPLLRDAIWREGNLPTGERVTSRTGLPPVAWRRFNEGITPGKSRTDQWDETIGQLEALSVLDKQLATLNGNAAAYRMTEDMGFLQALNNEVETRFFYGSTKNNPEIFMGLTPRFDASSSIGGSQIISAGSTQANQNTSIWLVKWSEDSVYAIYPKGSQPGVSWTDMGIQLWDDGTGKKYLAYVLNWNWKVGLVVKDYRQVVRIANIGTNTAGTGTVSLTTTGGSNGSVGPLIQNMVKATHQIYDKQGGNLVFYANRLVCAYLHLQAIDAVKNSTLTIERIGGEPVLMFMGIPVRETDGILNTEPVVS